MNGAALDDVFINHELAEEAQSGNLFSVRSLCVLFTGISGYGCDLADGDKRSQQV